MTPTSRQAELPSAGPGGLAEPDAVHTCTGLILALGRLRHVREAIVGLQVRSPDVPCLLV